MKITIILGDKHTNKIAKAIELVGWKNCHWLTPATASERLMTTRVALDEVTSFNQLERFLKLRDSLTELIIISSAMQKDDFYFSPLIYEEVKFIEMGVYTPIEEKRDLWLVGVAAVTLVALVYSFYLVLTAGR